MLLFFQATADTATRAVDTLNRAVQATTAQPHELRFGDLLIKGGWVMVPIGILAVLGLVVFFERFFTIRKAAANEATLLSQVKSNVSSGKLDSALAICRNSNSPLGRMLQKGLSRIGRPIKDIESAIENVGRIEISKLEKNIGILGIVAGIAPMFGFLGTIAGVIKIFYDISQTDNISMGVISGGLYVKMVTSAAGLLVGIVAYVLYNILQMMIEKLTLKLETESIDFIDLLEEPSK
ncbi:MotA/TolQ/ExbB proton channel family protein [Mucilaginibacter sp.]|uniref:MotA/TolQ/ExbB proton channel family protein n=1 Tax=Mucilaginibacter sp. TaxID=1882438 RepID=UPI003B003D70